MSNPMRWRFVAVLLLCALAPPGCTWLVPPPPGTSPLKPIELAGDGAELEVIFIRFPAKDPALGPPLWNQIDETAIPSSLRRELATNGLRTGLIGGPLPEVLARRIATADDQATPAAASAKISSEPIVRRWRVQAHRGRPTKIVASPVYEQLPLLTREEGQIRGQTYSQAQGLFLVEVDPQADGRVHIGLAPQIEYGESRQQWTGEDGVFRLQSGKPKRIFDLLKLDANLASGQTLVISCLPDRPGSLGHYLFTEPAAEGLEQKLLLLRLADTKYDDLFSKATRPDAAKAPMTKSEGLKKPE